MASKRLSKPNKKKFEQDLAWFDKPRAKTERYFKKLKENKENMLNALKWETKHNKKEEL